MVASRAEKERVPFNPAMLVWAREAAGVSVDRAAKRAGVKVEQIRDWESERPERMPTARQARELAGLYKRHFLEFFLPERPVLPEPKKIPDYRLFPASSDPTEVRELRDVQIWAEAQRANALDLFAEVGEEPPSMPTTMFATVNDDPEKASWDARAAIEFPAEDQIGRNAAGRRRIPNDLRHKIEAAGVLTLRRTDLRKLHVRGFCVAEFPLPLIVVGQDAETAQSFTLTHEFAHVMLRVSAISGTVPRDGGEPSKRKVEEWCNRFASAFLMPKRLVEEYMSPPSNPLSSITDETLHGFALHFGVSDHAAMIRLVHLRYIEAEYYWSVMKPKFDAIAAKKQKGGRTLYYGMRYINTQGPLYTSLVLEAWGMGRISGHHAAEFMGIKNIQHMYDIRDHFSGG